MIALINIHGETILLNPNFMVDIEMNRWIDEWIKQSLEVILWQDELRCFPGSPFLLRGISHRNGGFSGNRGRGQECQAQIPGTAPDFCVGRCAAVSESGTGKPAFPVGAEGVSMGSGRLPIKLSGSSWPGNIPGEPCHCHVLRGASRLPISLWARSIL